MTEQRIAEAQARLDALDGLPWHHSNSHGECVVRADNGPVALKSDLYPDDLTGEDAAFIARAPDDLRDALAALRRVRDVLKNRSRLVVSHPEDVEVVNVSDVLAALDGEG